MIIRLDDASYDRGFRDGNENKICRSQQELILSGFDELSCLSGFIDGKGRETIADSGDVAKDERLAGRGKVRGAYNDTREIA